MKKKILIIVIIILIIFIIFSNKRNLICSKIYNNKYMNIKYTYNNYFIYNKLYNVKYNMIVKINNNKDIIKKNIIKQYSEYKNIKGIIYNEKVEDNIIIIDIYIDLFNMNVEDRNKLDINELNYKDRKNKLISEDYFCK